VLPALKSNGAAAWYCNSLERFGVPPVVRPTVCLGLPTVYQAHFWLSKQGLNSVQFLSMAPAT
jgi:hypothetical protein